MHTPVPFRVINCLADHRAGATARPHIADTKADDRRGREGIAIRLDLAVVCSKDALWPNSLLRKGRNLSFNRAIAPGRQPDGGKDDLSTTA
jgi:hypothetical protein